MDLKPPSEKKSFLHRISFGSMLLLPVCVVLYLVYVILKICATFSHTLFWQFIFPNMPWPFEGIFTVLTFGIFAYIMGVLYFSKTWLSKLIDHCIIHIPILNFFWHPIDSNEGQALALSEMKAAVLQILPWIWIQVFIPGQQEWENGPALTKILWVTFPTPITGFVAFIEEEALRAAGKFYYLENPPSQVSKIYLSFGFNGPRFKSEK